MNPSVRMFLHGTPPSIVVERHNMDRGVWEDILLALNDGSSSLGLETKIRPDTLVGRRRILKGVLRRHGVRLEVDHAVASLLEAANRDSKALKGALDRVDHGGSASIDGRSIGPTLDLQTRFTRSLRDFQIRDFSKLASLPHGANFSVPGAGKTTVTFALHEHVKRAGQVNRLLVVAPLSAFSAWQEEATKLHEPPLTFSRWMNGPVQDTDLVLINYQRLLAAQVPLSIWMAEHAVHLVIDEAHRAKRGTAGEWGRAIIDLAPFAARRDILTGTPAPNHPRDIAALLDILWPGGEISRQLPDDALRADPSTTALSQMNHTIRPLYVRTTKGELKLPEPDIEAMLVRPGRIQRAIYDAMLNRYAGMFDLDRRDSAMFSQMGEVAMYLLQAASSPRLLAQDADPGRAYRFPPLSIPPGSRLAQLVESYSQHEVAPKIAHACAIARENALEKEKTLIWSNFPDNLLDLEQQLSALRPALIYGAIPSQDDAPTGTRTRERELDRFRNDPSCRVLLANPAAMAEGVSLHKDCHHAIYIDRTFNAGQYLQSLDRIHRLGLDPNITTKMTILITQGTIDERVARRVEQKTRRLGAILADDYLAQMALPDDEDYGAPMDDPADLEEILRHLQEDKFG
ncbi:DEAD/DEAH box helicase [Nonomuraea sp. LP-02]|uniref:DEAD/DEAH box helicase n=1 Tax=Nonomuraea sp. LP-02 TaxID=3097960 RepID=UPI002E3816CC|nr:DEAD/DEAH box helicase [Nonomuraea sp. LP-02]MED7930424.1 DEAD/DEAH box helicase [Nonomuraea sp. LP-02]